MYLERSGAATYNASVSLGMSWWNCWSNVYGSLRHVMLLAARPEAGRCRQDERLPLSEAASREPLLCNSPAALPPSTLDIHQYHLQRHPDHRLDTARRFTPSTSVRLSYLIHCQLRKHLPTCAPLHTTSDTFESVHHRVPPLFTPVFEATYYLTRASIIKTFSTSLKLTSTSTQATTTKLFKRHNITTTTTTTTDDFTITMSGKLDQSLDQIMSDTKPAGGRGRGGARKPRPARNAKSKAKAAIAAPTAGVQKTRATTRAPQVTAPVLTASTSSESKIIVSNLPEDVTEVQVKVR